MSRYCGNPVNQQSVKGNASQEAEEEGLLRSILEDNINQGDKRNPSQDGKVKLRKRESRDDSTQ